MRAAHVRAVFPTFPQRSAQASPQRCMILVLVATEVENLTRCGICRRSLLLGEPAAVYQDDRTRAIHTVCALCTQRAERAGWTTIGEPVSRPRLRVHTNNPAVDQDRLVQRLQADLERMQRELAGANGLLTSARTDTAAELARGSALEERDRASATTASPRSSREIEEPRRPHRRARGAAARGAGGARGAAQGAPPRGRRVLPLRHRGRGLQPLAAPPEAATSRRGWASPSVRIARRGHHAAAPGAGHLRLAAGLAQLPRDAATSWRGCSTSSPWPARSTARSSRRSGRCAATPRSSTAAWSPVGATS